MSNILLIHGPNLNMLGQREPERYGTDTLESINSEMIAFAQKKNVHLSTFQSNHEGQIIDRLQSTLADGTDFIIINPAAFSHTSIAIRDALLACNKPFIEVHLSNIYAREDFRHHSFLSDIAIGVISGLGKNSYLLGLQAAVSHCEAI